MENQVVLENILKDSEMDELIDDITKEIKEE